uniref:3-hydroxyacyl-CoA dehydrogenase type-2 n=1 Tax=Strigamia maritima TaxID=126957 RepID=T1IYZ4_STRMM
MSLIKSVTGSVALVTGAASGLGLAVVQRLSAKGAKIVMVDLPSSKGEQVAKQFKHDVIFAPADVTNENDVNSALNEAISKFGRIDAVVNCAGIGVACKTYDFKRKVPHSLADYENVLHVNTTGTFNVTRLAAGLLGNNPPNSDGQRGVIVNTASVAAFDGQKGHTAYAASNGGVVAMTLPFARDLASQGIRCCTIAAGLFESPLIKGLPKNAMDHLVSMAQLPKRVGSAEEFAHLVQFIIENPFINGETIRVDAAMRMP